ENTPDEPTCNRPSRAREKTYAEPNSDLVEVDLGRHFRCSLLRILFEDLFSFKGSLSPRFVCVKHDDRYCGTSGRSTRNGSASEATRIRVHETTTVSPVDVGIAASYGTGHYRTLPQRSVSEFEMRIAAIKCGLGRSPHRRRYSLPCKKPPARLRIYTNDVRR